MTRSSDEDLDRYAREATDREMERRLQRLQRQTAPIQKRDAPAPAGIYFPPHVERRRRLFYAELAQAGIVSGWGLTSGRHVSPDCGPGRDGQGLDLTHWVRTLEDDARPNGPSAWAQLDTTHPIEKMFRKGSLAPDEAVAAARYRAAQVWDRFFRRAHGIGGGGGFMSESVDGSADPQASAVARMDATRERLYVMDEPGMTLIRFSDLDSVCGAGMRIADISKRSGRDPKTIRESLFSGLDVVTGYARWDRLLQGVQIVAAYEERRRA